MTELNVIFYRRPLGTPVDVVMTNIRETTAAYFRDGNFAVSFEEVPGFSACLYADTGKKDDHNEPIEALYLVPEGMSCEDGMDNLMAVHQKMRGEG